MEFLISKRKPRQYGTGAVYQRASDGRWVGTVEAGWTAKGTRRRATVSGKTEAETKRKLGDKQREIARAGVPSQQTSSRTTVKNYADQWLDRLHHEVAPSTYAGYASSTRKWIIPAVGHRRLVSLNPGDVRAVTNAVRDAGRRPSTMRHAQITFEKLIRAAMLDGHQIPQNALLVDLPGKGGNDRTAVELADALTMLEAASRQPDGVRWALSFLQGLRQAEALGLTWAALDLDEAVAVISWQLRALPYKRAHDRSSGFRVPDGYEHRQLDGALHLVRPKSQSGWRTQPLVPWMVDALRAWQEVAPASKYGLVFPRPDGRPRVPRDDTQAWKDLQDDARVAHVDGEHGRRYDGHEARHATATLLMEAGIDKKVITAILGHSSIATSRGYMHVRQEQSLTALEGIAARLRLTAGPEKPAIEG